MNQRSNYNHKIINNSIPYDLITDSRKFKSYTRKQNK